MTKILVVDDEMSIRESFSLILEGKYKVLTAASGEGALKIISDQKIDLAFLDIRMPGLDGLETLKKMKQIDPDLEVVMVTAVNEVQKASQAIKLGARDYIIKPFDVEAIIKMSEQLLRRKNLLRQGVAMNALPSRLIGQNERLIELQKVIDKVAPRELKFLITGEAGTEKETVAEMIHAKSPRAQQTFLTFDLSPSMSRPHIERRLFGQGKGSTVADLGRFSGMMDEARNGTLLLNHVEYLPDIYAQLETANVRLIGASDRSDLAEKNKAAFDFFSEVSISLPPLRERISDLPLFITYFLEELNSKYNKEVKEIAPEVEELFSNYKWPGNVAELKAVLERMVMFAESDKIEAANLPLDLLLNSSVAFGSNYLSLFEKEYSRKVFENAGRDKNRAAKMLGVNPSLLNL